MNKEIGVLLLLFAFCYSPCRAQDPVPDVKNYTVMTGGNSWLVGTGTGKIAEAGYIYNEHSQSFATYFYAGVVTGAVQIYLSLSNSVPVYIEMSVVTQYIQIGPVPASTDICEVAIGKFSLENDTYIKVFVQIFPATAGDKLNGVVQSLIFEGSMTNTVYIPAGVANFYAGRKSPGANLWLSIPTYEEITHFYSEITMPVGFDTDGAYFLTHGWSSGQAGFQPPNRALMGIWSVYEYNTSLPPGECTVDVVELGVGSGGVSHGQGTGQCISYNFTFVAGTTYAMLVTSEKDFTNNSTIICDYINIPEQGGWYLIACVRKRKSLEALRNLYQLLQNTNTDNGNKGRQGVYGNHWVKTARGSWVEVLSASFFGRKDIRRDLQASVVNGGFMLKRGGFFSDDSDGGTLVRNPTGRPPNFDRSQVKNLPPPASK